MRVLAEGGVCSTVECVMANVKTKRWQSGGRIWRDAILDQRQDRDSEYGLNR